MFIKNKLWQKIITVLTAALFLVSISVLTAAADEGSNPDTAITDDGNVDSEPVDSGDNAQPESPGIEQSEIDNGQDDNNGGYDGDYGQDDNYEYPTVYIPEDIQNQYEQIRDDYIDRLEDLGDNLSQYIPNDNLNNLPTVAAAEIVPATAEPLPDVAISDASLFSGIVMWLCVVVGISVIAGVMVSKRTHRKGA